MNSQKKWAQFKVSRVSIWIALCLLVIASAAPATHAATYAQGAPPGWTEPEDIAAPLSLGSDLYGVLLCDPNQNLHVLWGKRIRVVRKSTTEPTRTAAYRPP